MTVKAISLSTIEVTIVIQKFDAEGNLLLRFGSTGTVTDSFQDRTYGTTYSIIFMLTILRQGHTVVVEKSTLVQKFDTNGKFITKWGSIGKGRRSIQGSRTLAA